VTPINTCDKEKVTPDEMKRERTFLTVMSNNPKSILNETRFVVVKKKKREVK
jgi:hypothetical protein